MSLARGILTAIEAAQKVAYFGLAAAEWHLDGLTTSGSATSWAGGCE
jgi:hypothetical protein